MTDEQFEKFWTGLQAMQGLHPNYTGKELTKVFVSSLLADQRKELVEKIEKLKYRYSFMSDGKSGIKAEAIEEVLSIINQDQE